MFRLQALGKAQRGKLFKSLSRLHEEREGHEENPGALYEQTLWLMDVAFVLVCCNFFFCSCPDLYSAPVSYCSVKQALLVDLCSRRPGGRGGSLTYLAKAVVRLLQGSIDVDVGDCAVQ